MPLLEQLLEESIALELNVSDLYHLYCELYPEDRGFWWKLTMEEKNHAAVLKSARLFLQVGKLPPETIHPNLEIVKRMNEELSARTKTFKLSPPDAEVAYKFAIALEESANEYHFQQLMSKVSDNKVINIFKDLSHDDRDHARRIRLALERRAKES